MRGVRPPRPRPRPTPRRPRPSGGQARLRREPISTRLLRRWQQLQQVAQATGQGVQRGWQGVRQGWQGVRQGWRRLASPLRALSVRRPPSRADLDATNESPRRQYMWRELYRKLWPPAAVATDDGQFQRAWLRPRYWPVWIGLGLLWLLLWFPQPLRRLIGAIGGELLWRINRKRRHITRVNLKLAMPQLTLPAREALARRSFRRYLQSALDYPLLWWGFEWQLRRRLKLVGGEQIDDLLAAGRRVILVTPHVVGLDAGATLCSRYWPITGPMKRLRHPIINWLVARGRTRFDCRTYSREQGIRPVVRDLQAGRLLYYLPDEDLGATQKYAFAPFFGVQRATLTALPRLALLADAVVVPCHPHFDPVSGDHTLRILSPLNLYPSGDEADDTAHLNLMLEAVIRRAPEQYLWSQRLFQTRPAGERNPYHTPAAMP